MVAAAACGDQQQSDDVTGPRFAPKPPPNSAGCEPNSLNSLISGYFPGSSGSAIKSLKDDMIAAGTNTAGARDAGFEILDSIGSASRNPAYTLDPVAGSDLAQGVVRCMFDASTFSPAFPADPIYDFAPALTHAAAGAFYVRGAGAAGTATVVGALLAPGPDTTVISGVAPMSPATWTSSLAGNTGSEGRVLIYGFPVTQDPLVYEWATLPPAATFSPGAIVALCDDNPDSDVMVHESTVGVLAYSTGDPICAAPISMALRETGWGPRALATRLVRAMGAALTPTSLQAAVAAKSGSGGTATTFKSKFKTEPVAQVTIKYTQAPPKVMKLNQTYPIEVRATSVVNGATAGVNGVCVYLTGTNNNGQPTDLEGTADTSCQSLSKAVFKQTESKTVGGQPAAGYAAFQLKVTKNGGLLLTAGATDDQGSPIGVIGRDGQTFLGDEVKVNVKP
jgi:hypothetical protein